MTMASSRSAPDASRSALSEISRARAGQRAMTARATPCAAAPETRTTHSAPRPAAVACATIVAERSRSCATRGALSGQHVQRLARLQNPYPRAQVVRLQSVAKAADGIVRGRRHVAKSAPVIRYEQTRAEPLEELERVVVRQVAFPEARLPPG